MTFDMLCEREKARVVVVVAIVAAAAVVVSTVAAVPHKFGCLQAAIV